MSESELNNAILLAHSRGDTRLFRVNAGMAWQGKVIMHTRDQLLLANPYAIKLATPGVSDLIGWSPGGIFTAIESKFGKGRLRPEQAMFLELVRRCGGHAGVARSVEDAGLIIQGEIRC